MNSLSKSGDSITLSGLIHKIAQDISPMVKRLIVSSLYGMLSSTMDNLKQLNRCQWYSKEEAHRDQKRRLRQLLRHSAENTDYYGGVLRDCGVVDSSGAVHLGKFGDIPLLDKEVLTQQFDSLHSSDLPKRSWKENTSGGSTGQPARFLQDDRYYDWGRAVKILYDRWTGYSLADRRVVLWGAERDILDGSRDPKKRFRDWLTNSLLLNSFKMGPEQMGRFVQEINDFEPIQILAYAESIFDLSQFIQEYDNELGHSPKAILSSAGTLHPHMREVIEEVFDAPVFNRYGSREAGDMACECPEHEGLHVCMPTHYVELLNGDGNPVRPGETGEVVVTVLQNYAMPLIRYRIGDTAIWADHDCSCGRGWPLLEKVVGRVTDNFVTTDGELIHGEFFTHLFYFRDWVEKFQVVQRTPRHIEVFVVALEHRLGDDIVQADKKEIISNIQRVMGEGTCVDFEFVDEIEPTPSGKHRFSISHVHDI